MKAGWIYPFIILGGVLQTCGAAMNGQLNKALVNPWLASTVSFGVITAFFLCVFAVSYTSAQPARPLGDAVVGTARRVGRCCSGLRGIDFSEQGRRWAICRVHGDGRSRCFAGCRPLRSVPHGGSRFECVAHSRGASYGEWHSADRQVLKTSRVAMGRQSKLRIASLSNIRHYSALMA
jgi:hypothetical protein